MPSREVGIFFPILYELGYTGHKPKKIVSFENGLTIHSYKEKCALLYMGKMLSLTSIFSLCQWGSQQRQFSHHKLMHVPL